jgi:hypothetical protein
MVPAGSRVWRVIWCELGGIFLNFEFNGFTDTGTGAGGVWVRVHGAAGKRVQVQRFFAKKKMVTGPSQTRTHIPVYPPITEHRYGYPG